MKDIRNSKVTKTVYKDKNIIIVLWLAPCTFPKGNQRWIFIGRTDADAEAPILWLPDANNGLIGKDLDAGKDWRQEEKGMTEDEMVGWHHRLYGHEFEQALGVSDGQGSLACSSPWDHKELDTTEWLNWTELKLETGWREGVTTEGPCSILGTTAVF